MKRLNNTVKIIIYNINQIFAQSTDSLLENMRYWLIPSNQSQFDLVTCVDSHHMVYWRQTRYKYKTGDIVFMYATGNIGRILYVMEVEESDISNSQDIIDFSKEYRIFDLPPTERVNKFQLLQKVDTPLLDQKHLKEHGLRGNVQGPQTVNGSLLEYILNCLDNCIK